METKNTTLNKRAVEIILEEGADDWQSVLNILEDGEVLAELFSEEMQEDIEEAHAYVTAIMK